MKCRGKNKQGKPCRKSAITGRNFCRNHGGACLRGAEHPNFKHGRRSKYLPTRLADKYGEAIADLELTEYRHQIAVLSLRADELLESGESFLLWDRAQVTFGELETSIRSGDTLTMNNVLLTLHDLLKRGRDDSLRWREWYEVNEREGRMKEREHKRLFQMQQMISAEQFLAFIGALVNVATTTITDRDQLRRFTVGVDALWGGVVGQRGH